MRRPRLLVATVIVAVTAVSACSDEDVFPRDEYVKAVTENGVTKAVAECAYDSFKDDKTIMAELIRADGPTDDISDKAAAEMSNALARCIVAAEDAKNPPPTTTTEPKKGRTTTTEKKQR